MMNFLSSTIIEFDKYMAVLCIILGVTGMCSYLFGSYLKFGFTKSISISYGLWESATYDMCIGGVSFVHNLRWIFQLFMYFSALMILCIAQTGWYLIVAALFSLMAMFPSVWVKKYLYPHCVFATSAIVLGLIGLPICYQVSYMIAFPIVALVGDILIGIFVKQHPTKYDTDTTTKLYWIEVFSISIMILGLIDGTVCKILG